MRMNTTCRLFWMAVPNAAAPLRVSCPLTNKEWARPRDPVTAIGRGTNAAPQHGGESGRAGTRSEWSLEVP